MFLFQPSYFNLLIFFSLFYWLQMQAAPASVSRKQAEEDEGAQKQAEEDEDECLVCVCLYTMLD